jgi:cobalt-zinc-cadmium efflux system outer membrane protein
VIPLAAELLDGVSVAMTVPFRQVRPSLQARPSLKVCSVLTVLLVALPCFAAAGPPVPEELSLREAVVRALARNPDVEAARTDVAQAEAQLVIARQLPNPTLSASTTKIPTDGGPAGTPLGNGFLDRSYDTVVSLGQPLEIGGKRRDRRLSADASLAAARARVRNAERSVGNAVARAYVAALVARESAGIARETAASLSHSADLAKVRYDAGDISAADRLQIEIAEGRFRADAETAEGNARTSLVALTVLLGDSSQAASLQLSGTLETLVGAALTPSLAPSREEPGPTDVIERRPDVDSARLNVEKAEADRALQVAFRIPDPTILVQYEREPPDRSSSAGVGVSFTVPLFNQNTGAIRAAEAARDASRVELQRVRSKAAGELATAASSLETTKRRVHALAGELLEKARQVRDTVAFAWNEGSASLLELLEAERSLNDLKLAAATAQGDLVQAAADERAARGFLPVDPQEKR